VEENIERAWVGIGEDLRTGSIVPGEQSFS
jgi:hypothetical protein